MKLQKVVFLAFLLIGLVVPVSLTLSRQPTNIVQAAPQGMFNDSGQNLGDTSSTSVRNV